MSLDAEQFLMLMLIFGALGLLCIATGLVNLWQGFMRYREMKRSIECRRESYRANLMETDFK